MAMQSAAALTPQQERRASSKRRFSAAFEPWLYLSPALILLLVVLLVPLIVGVSYSFRKFSAFKSEYVGLAQYKAMLSDPVLGQALINTLWWTVAACSSSSSSGWDWRFCSTGRSPGKQGCAGDGVPALGGAVLPVRPDMGLAVQPHCRAVAALAFCAWPAIGADQYPFRSGHCDVGTDHRQCLVRRAVLRHHAVGGTEIDPVRIA
jgi:hypothetical protein